MRRTFNDLMRTAQVEAIVTRSISGHLTERLQEHHSTVSGAEPHAGIAKVTDLMAPGGACMRLEDSSEGRSGIRFPEHHSVLENHGFEPPFGDQVVLQVVLRVTAGGAPNAKSRP
jgi:hypothetical protein